MKRIQKFQLICTMACFVVCFVSGCSAPLKNRSLISQNAQNNPGNAQNTYYYTNNPYEGSLWTPCNTRSFLFVDNKARNINDIITVKITEEADAKSDANTKVSRKGGLKSNITKFFGSTLSFGMDNLWGKNTGAATAAERVERPFKPDIETSSENSFDGKGSTARKEKLVATISAKVVNVFPNRNMFIRGEREVRINDEKQLISLSGIIRPEDINSDNIVVSSAIADAKISISGKGVVADKQDPGYGHRFIDWAWPF